MFGKKKVFPEGTFIPNKTRMVVIIQLCLAFALITWSAIQPFMGEFFSHKTRLNIYQMVMGNPQLIHTVPEETKNEIKEKINRNHSRFLLLPIDVQEKIQTQYKDLNAPTKTTFLEKTKRAFNILIFEIPPFSQAWIFFSIILSILLLLRIEGAQAASYLLPFIVLIYGMNNFLFAPLPPKSPDHSLFPSEKMIVENYLDEPFSHQILEQKEQLTKGWKRYLVQNWTKQEPSKDKALFEQQVEEGEFFFQMARLDKLSGQPLIDTKTMLRTKEAPFVLMLYLGWNLFFALFVNRKNALA